LCSNIRLILNINNNTLQITIILALAGNAASH
jgi:hypothetical protein